MPATEANALREASNVHSESNLRIVTKFVLTHCHSSYQPCSSNGGLMTGMCSASSA